jgi:hypothetical protein
MRTLRKFPSSGIRLFGGVLLAFGLLVPSPSPAQEPTSDPPTIGPRTPGKTEPAAVIGGADAAQVGAAEVLSFKQAKVSAEAGELEDRMFRLSEALKQMEPENASRLLLALKFAREELIRLQMQQSEKLLNDKKLDEAVSQQKQVLAKLERLHDLLLSNDLDFQMKLQRLRQIREILRRLESAIQEENRQVGLSQEHAAKQQEAEGLRKRRPTLTELIERQSAHVAQSQQLAADSSPDALGKLTRDQARTQRDTRSLAGDPPPADGGLSQAEAHMGKAVDSLKARQGTEALPHQQRALEALKNEAERMDRRLAQLERELDPARFAAQRQEQAGNRTLTSSLAESTRNLGESGIKPLAELLRAAGNMQSAEDALQLLKAGQAGADQQDALDSLKQARRDLQDDVQRLLDQLSHEIRNRVIEGLQQMLEQQIAVRESTTTLGPKAAQGSRQALTAVVALALRERQIVEIADGLIQLVEETEFGVALPSALRVVRRDMTAVEFRLQRGDASAEVIAAEQRIESDLQVLLEAMKRMPATRRPESSDPQRGSQDREHELNRLVAELKMIRLVQQRVNGETVDVDGQRLPSDAELSETLRRQIGQVEVQQEDVRKTTEKLSERLE